MNVNKVLTKDYENNTNCKLCENKPNTNPIKANFKKAKMNVTSLITKDYENKSNCSLAENKPNTKPIQTQTKPISPLPCTEQLVRKYPIFAVKSLLKIAEKGCSAYKNATKAVKQKQNSIY